MKNERIEFANTLRGFAAISVMIAHYLMVFPHIQGAIAGFSPLPNPVLKHVEQFVTLGIPHLNYGPLGVAIFFLVSGFVIPISLEKYSGKFGAISFLIARAFRLWPLYAVAAIFSATIIWLSHWHNNAEFRWTAGEILLTTTLFRDWIGIQQLDGIVWSLEVEVKFYLLCAIFSASVRQARPSVALFVTPLVFLGYYYKVEFPNSWNPPSNFLFPAPFIAFMTIGTAFYGLMKRKISARYAVTWTALALLLFCASSRSIELTINYTLATIIFGSSFMLREKFKPTPVLSQLADISYPVYAIHAVFGYVGMRVMMGAGVDSWKAVAIMVVLVVALASMLHVCVERPSRVVGAKIAGALKDRFNREGRPSLVNEHE